MSESRPTVVSVSNLYKTFRLPLEQVSGIKQAIVKIGRRKKGFDAQHVLSDVSFDIQSGEFFGIVGRNGSGKSTLLKLLAGIYVPDSGHVGVEGTLTPFIELGVGFNPELTGRENVFLNGALLGFSRADMMLMYDDIVEFAELEKFMDQKLKNYSSGMQVRLAFSIAIRAKSDILLIDEVLAVGDAAFQQKCFDYFEKLRSNKQTIILVTHDMNAVKRFCDRALLISDGKIEMIGLPEEVADLYTEMNIDSKKESDTADESESYIECVFPKKLRYAKSDEIEFKIGLTRNVEDDCFVSVSFVSQGFVFANMNSKFNKNDTQLKFHNNIIFNQRLDGFNDGKYDIHISLHKTANDGLLEHIPRAYTFVVTGKDPSRDGPMRIDGNWSAEPKTNKETKE